jgi:hypothetical protein
VLALLLATASPVLADAATDAAFKDIYMREWDVADGPVRL